MNDKDRKLEIINEYLEITQQKGIVKNLNQYLVQKLMNNHNTLMRKRLLDQKLDIVQAKQDKESELSKRLKKRINVPNKLSHYKNN